VALRLARLRSFLSGGTAVAGADVTDAGMRFLFEFDIILLKYLWDGIIVRLVMVTLLMIGIDQCGNRKK